MQNCFVCRQQLPDPGTCKKCDTPLRWAAVTNMKGGIVSIDRKHVDGTITRHCNGGEPEKAKKRYVLLMMQGDIPVLGAV